MHQTTPGAVLVTGVCGVLGAEVAAQLLRHGYQVVGMLHKRTRVRLSDGTALFGPDIQPPAGFTVVHGRLGEPDLGFSFDDYRQLLGTIGAVVHCGAVTRFGLPRGVYLRANVAGTEELLRFCHKCTRAIDVVHVSTAFVVGGGRQLAEEQHVVSFKPQSVNFYEESKYLGELALHRLGFGDRAVIVRPSIIAGAEKHGRIREFDNFYVALKAATSGHVSTVPGDYSAILNIVPIDYVTNCVIAALRGVRSLHGTVLHAVSRTGITMQDFSEVLAEYPELHVPRFVSPESFEAAPRTPLERRIYDSTLRVYEPYFNQHVQFANANSKILLGRVPPGGRPYLRRLLDHALAAGYLGARQAVAS